MGCRVAMWRGDPCVASHGPAVFAGREGYAVPEIGRRAGPGPLADAFFLPIQITQNAQNTKLGVPIGGSVGPVQAAEGSWLPVDKKSRNILQKRAKQTTSVAKNWLKSEKSPREL